MIVGLVDLNAPTEVLDLTTAELPTLWAPSPVAVRPAVAPVAARARRRPTPIRGRRRALLYAWATVAGGLIGWALPTAGPIVLVTSAGLLP